jgi:hypothetical protein
MSVGKCSAGLQTGCSGGLPPPALLNQPLPLNVTALYQGASSLAPKPPQKKVRASAPEERLLSKLNRYLRFADDSV